MRQEEEVCSAWKKDVPSNSSPLRKIRKVQKEVKEQNGRGMRKTKGGNEGK